MSSFRRSAGNFNSGIAAATATVSLRAATRNPNPTPIVIPDVPTSAYYDDVINSAGRSGDFDTLRHLLNKRVKDGCFNTSRTFKFLTQAESSLTCLPDLIGTLARLDGGFTRKSAFDALIARLCRLGRYEESMRAVEAMARGGFGLNAVTFHPILNLLTRKRQIDDGYRVMDVMRSYGISPDVTAHNYFLTAHCVVGDLKSAARVMEAIEEEGLGADTRTYDALVLGACRARKVEAAVEVLRRMAEEGVSPLYSTHVHVIKSMVKMGGHVQALEFVRSYSGRDRELDSENYGVLGSELMDRKMSEEAKVVVQEMVEKGLAVGKKLSEFYRENVRVRNE